ncbi:MAG: type II secretion system protein GspL [Pseudomonadota bacterium]
MNRSVLYLKEGALFWLESGAADEHAVEDAGVRNRLKTLLSQREHQVVFAVSGAEVRLFQLALAPEERRHLDASLPFMLEEQLTEDIDDLHFARYQPSKNQVDVAVVRRSSMEYWEEALGEFADSVPWISEPLLIPWTDGDWTIVIREGDLLIRYGRSEGTQIELDLAGPLLSALTESHPPEHLIVYGKSEQEDIAQLPNRLRDHLQQESQGGGSEALEWRRGGLAQALLLAGSTADSHGVSPSRKDIVTGLNLRQGSYAPSLPYAVWWSQWKAVAVVAAVALAVHLVAGWLDLRHLQRQTIALNDEVTAVYRSVNPRGAVPDVEKQLKNQLSALRGDGSGRTFSSFVEPLAAVVAAQEGTVLASLNFSQRTSELRVNLYAAGFSDVEQLRQSLTDRGYSAVLENSSRSGTGVRARLRIGDRS